MSPDPFLVHVDERPAEEDAALLLRACFFFLPFPFGCPRWDGTPRANSSSAWSWATRLVCVSHKVLATLVAEDLGLAFLLLGPLTDSEKLPLPFGS